MTDRILALVKSISPQTIEKCKKRDVAAENEAKYGKTDESGLDDAITTIYRDIATGFDNGRCATRQGTYRSFKRKVAKHEIVDRKSCRTNYR